MSSCLQSQSPSLGSSVYLRDASSITPKLHDTPSLIDIHGLGIVIVIDLDILDVTRVAVYCIVSPLSVTAT